jgi:glycosyltransferase involved in cell wall biosynthesis
VVAGDGPLRPELEALTHELGLHRQVTFAGWLPHPDALALIDTAAVCCLAARVSDDGDRDTMPTMLKEAMARARPVVATAVGGIPELVDDSVGWLVAPNDPLALAAAIRAALDDPGDAASRGRAGARRILARFTAAEQVSRLLDLWLGS